MPIDLTRSVLVILIPGGVAASPWLLALVLHSEATLGFARDYATLANAFVLAICAIMGLTCESLGTRQEVAWDIEREDDLEVKENWYQYLAGKHDPEPVGFKYISRLATTMYFELSMLYAIGFFAPGAALMIYLRFENSFGAVCGLVFAILMALICDLFRADAKDTHEVLCKTRKELNERLKGST